MIGSFVCVFESHVYSGLGLPSLTIRQLSLSVTSDIFEITPRTNELQKPFSTFYSLLFHHFVIRIESREPSLYSSLCQLGLSRLELHAAVPYRIMEFKNRVGQFDELVRCYKVLIDNVNLEEVFLSVVSQQGECILKHQDAIEECRRLKLKLDLANKDMNVVVEKLGSARRWLDAERQKRKRVEQEREDLARHLDEVRRILLNDPRQIKLSDEAKEKLAFLNRGSSESSLNDGDGRPHLLNTIAESDSFSDMSYSRSVDDLDTDIHMAQQPNKRNRSVFLCDETAVKKRKPSFDGPPILPSPPRPPPPYTPMQPDVMKTPVPVDMIEVYRGVSSDDAESAVHQINKRRHTFVSKTFIMPESCSWCSKRIGFGRSVYKCLDCQIVAHPECKDNIVLPCVPSGASPKKVGAGLISDFTPSIPPMVPAVVVHCAMEVERRGLTEIGIYRLSATDAIVRGLREKFLKGRGVPCLTDVDIHSVCCFLKDFLRNLQDPLIPQNKRSAFVAAVNGGDIKQEELVKLIQTLPQANRDTLAYLILHLQNVAQAPKCEMPASNLATVFGPTVVGYSNDIATALTDAHVSNAIMEQLLILPPSFWNDILAAREPRTPLLPSTTLEAKTPLFGDPYSKTPRRQVTMPMSGSKRKFFRTSPPSVV